MKSIKRLVLLLLVLSLTVLSFTGCIEPKTYEATDDSYFVFEELQDKTYSIKAADVSNLPEKVYIPKEYNGKSVSMIDDNAFMMAEITELYIPSNVTLIGVNAFNGCESLAKIYFTKGLEKIDNGAFYGCSSLKELSLPSSLKYIGDSAFVGIAITRLNLPEKVEVIGSSAFAYCANLTSVYIGHNAHTIAENAFNGVNSAVEFEISGSNQYYCLDSNGKLVKIS